MTYQVLARKYRPQTFSEVIGQEHITSTLQNALTSKRIHHAYLFTGARGIGKTTVARLLAKALNCEVSSAIEPCNQCRSCQDITSGSSLDVQEIDGASNTGVDDVREIRDRVQYLPSSGKYKIYIIDEVHMLSTNAFNALLKTLEEPPAHVVFVFATTEVHKIPATILSRCQRYDFRRISVSKIVQALQMIASREKINVQEDALQLLAREASGSMRDAESLFDQAIAFSEGDISTSRIQSMLGFLDRKRLFEMIEAVIDREPQRGLLFLEEMFNEGLDLSRLTFDFLEMFRHLLVLKSCGGEVTLLDLPSEEIERLRFLASKRDVDELQQLFTYVYRASDDIARSSFPKLLLEILLLRLCRVEPVRPIGELMEKIEQFMESREPAPSPKKIEEAARNWPEFQRWLVANEPRMASLLQHAVDVVREGENVKLSFENSLYADMLLEEERKKHLAQLLERFFHQKFSLVIDCRKGEQGKKGKEEKIRSQAVTKEALESNAVREAANILGGRVHDVKILSKE
ncbi:MAG: DNA polymerase III, subunit gamma and tau [Deltaproteobacteria bacterium RIFCSPLOWO2_02_FULL_44_10]|nr:MAG: DNA polymerase III, subunit gamma and tau [Deltaproteobacteria bacterium RIFCSPHIGHO2_02_FULL_44_16]OGQ45240.1 MAG: DNA polymerase III, subunit gamma and tau [Deltaproteobacteria bacterium RIFCSPLOWO2_02_FULL_44_10]